MALRDADTAATLAPRVGALLGMTLGDTTSPTKAQVETWIADGQLDLCGRLAPDAMPHLLKRAAIVAGIPEGHAIAPGTRVVMVLVLGNVARHVSPSEFSALSTAGVLFRPTAASPIWALFPGQNSDVYGKTYIQTHGAGINDAGEVIYFAPPPLYDPSSGTVIYLQEYLYPLIIRYALCQAKIADEDDVGAQIIHADYIRAIQEVNGLQAGRDPSMAPGKPDGAI